MPSLPSLLSSFHPFSPPFRQNLNLLLHFLIFISIVFGFKISSCWKNSFNDFLKQFLYIKSLRPGVSEKIFILAIIFKWLSRSKIPDRKFFFSHTSKILSTLLYPGLRILMPIWFLFFWRWSVFSSKDFRIFPCFLCSCSRRVCACARAQICPV